ncbi:MAG TPA: GSCFA domain-containing protein [Rhizomicrobium sp.]|nr:GSCFA domain-containing protein [Rhizomicrobium sp.]
MKSPYSNLPPQRFWRTGVCESDPQTIDGLYRKKFTIAPTDNVATAGSCFAQRIAMFMRANGFTVMDLEPPPPELSAEDAKKAGYSVYSARYGNIYTVRQLLQLAQDAQSSYVDPANVWAKNGRFYDALRPNIGDDGFTSVEDVLAERRAHLAKVKQLFDEMDVFIFTFGLTEAWLDRKSGRVFPTAPGTIAGDYDPAIIEFKNFGFNEIYDDFVAFQDLVRKANPDVRFILTVSPVPMTATATDKHVLTANTYLKSLLRTVAGALSDDFDHIDYFPGYEMVATPFSKAAFYEDNMRLVSAPGLKAVMRVFFEQHGEHRVQGALSESEPLAATTQDGETSAARQPAGKRAERKAAKRLKRRNRRAERGASTADDKAERRRNRQAAKIAKEEAACEDALLAAFAPS